MSVIVRVLPMVYSGVDSHTPALASSLSDLNKGGGSLHSDHVDNYSTKVRGLESLTSLNGKLLQ